MATVSSPPTAAGSRSSSPIAGLRGRALDQYRTLADGAAVLFGTVLIAFQGSRLGRWVIDDAAVTYAYARSVATGLGPVAQSGVHPVEAYSNPSWLAVLVVGRWLGLFDHRTWFGVSDLVLYPKMLAVLCTVGILVAITAAARVLVRNAWLVTLVATVLLGFNSSFLIWMFSGLENPLYALTVSVLAALLVRAVARGGETELRLAVFVGLLTLLTGLTRPDGSIYVGAYPLLLLVLLKRSTLRDSVRAVAVAIGTWLVPYVGFLLWRHSEFGLWVPNTAIAKSQSVPDPADLAKVGNLLDFAGWSIVLASVLVLGTLLSRPGVARRALLGVLAPLLVALVDYGILDQDWMPQNRFATPIWALSAMAVAIGAVLTLEQSRFRARVLWSVTAVAVLALSLPVQRTDFLSFRKNAPVAMCTIANEGKDFNTLANILDVKQGSLLIPDIGGVLLTTRLTVIDSAGLANSAIAKAYQNNDHKAMNDYIYGQAKPTFVQVHAAWMIPAEDPRLKQDYDLLYHRGTVWDYVRKDAVPSAGALAQAQAWASTVMSRQSGTGLHGCGNLTKGEAFPT
jgi:hypothetical protein